MRSPIPEGFLDSTNGMIVRSPARATSMPQTDLIGPEFKDAAMVVGWCRVHKCKLLIEL